MNSNTVAPARALNQEKATDQIASAIVANTPNLWTSTGLHQVGSHLRYGAKVERDTPGGVEDCVAVHTVGNVDAHR